MNDALTVNCAEWLEIAEVYPAEMEVVMDMMIQAEWEFCS